MDDLTTQELLYQDRAIKPANAPESVQLSDLVDRGGHSPEIVPLDSGNPHTDIAGLVNGLYGSAEHVPATPPEVSPEQEGDQPQLRRPTIPSFLQSLQTGDDNKTAEPVFSELTDGQLNASMDPETQLRGQFAALKDKTPAERAKIGGQFGAKIGAATQGLHGAVLGASIGAVAARSMGILQTGEHEDNVRKDKIFETLKTVGIADDKNKITFDDGVSFDLTTDPSFKLKNLDASVTGERDRANTDVDKSHPLTKRTTAAALPLAYYMAHGLLNWGDQKNPRDNKALQNATGVMVNALQKDAKNINQVYDRARQWAKKYGDEDTMRSFFNTIKDRVPEADASMIRQGLDAIFPK